MTELRPISQIVGMQASRRAPGEPRSPMAPLARVEAPPVDRIKVSRLLRAAMEALDAPLVRTAAGGFARAPMPDGAEAILAEAKEVLRVAQAQAGPAPEEVMRRWLLKLAVATTFSPSGDKLEAELDVLVQLLRLPACCFTDETLIQVSLAVPEGRWPRFSVLHPLLMPHADPARQRVEKMRRLIAALQSARPQAEPQRLTAPVTDPADEIDADLREYELKKAAGQTSVAISARAYRARLQRTNPQLAARFATRLDALASRPPQDDAH